MASVIDALFITLGLDSREYDKKRKEVNASLKKFGDESAKQTKLIAEHGKKAAGAFSLLKVEVLGALAAFGMGAGFKAFIESSMNGQAQLGRLSTALGMSTHNLQAWKLMAQEVGGSGEDAIGTLQKVASGLANARRGDVTFLANANKYGAGLTLDDTTTSAMSKINRMASAIREKYGAQQAMGVLGEMGIGNFLQQQRLMENPAQFAQDMAHAMSLTGAATQASTKQAARLQAQWADLHERFRQVGERAFVKLEPVLEKLATQLADWIDSVDWDKVIDKAGKFFQKLGQIVDALGGVKGILIEIAAIKVFGWIVSVGMWVAKLRTLTAALAAARLAAAGAGAAGAGAAATGGAAAAGGAEAVGGAGVMAGAARFVSSWALPIWALFHSESTGGKQRADGTYEDEVDWNSPEQQAGIARQKAAQDKNTTQMFSSLESKYGLPSGLLDSVYSAESSRGKNLVSPKGALGPFQFMPATAAQYGLTGSDVNDTSKAADAAARYLHNLIAQFNGNIPAAIAAYNWGPGNVQRKGMSALPQETSDYISKVLGGMSGYVGARSEAAKSGESTTTNTVSIGTVSVNAPKATDANGIAMSVRKAFRDNPLIAGSVTALA